MSIDVQSSSKEDGVGLILYSTTYNDNQKFKVTKAGDNQFTITAVHSGKNWTSSGVLGDKVTQAASNGSSSQLFTIKQTANGFYSIQDSKGLFISFSDGKAVKNASVSLGKEAKDMSQEFLLYKVIEPTPTPTPKPKSDLIPDVLEPITYKSSTNEETIKEGWYHMVVANNYIRTNSAEAILSRSDYANYFYIKSLGGRLYSIRSPYGEYLNTKYAKPVNGEKITLKTLQDDDYSILGWIIEKGPGENVFTIRPSNNKDLIVSAEGGSLLLTKKPSKEENTHIVIFPQQIPQ